MAGQKFNEMLGHADRSHPRATAAMRDAKRLVQVQMADIRAEVGRATKADLRIHIRAVQIDLSPEPMDDFTNLLDAFLEHAVCGRIGDHQAGEVVVVRPGLGAQVGEVDVAFLVASDGDDFQTSHHRAGGIGTVGRGRDEADVAMRFAAAFVITADQEETGVFALRTGVRLQRNGREAGDFREPSFELLEQNLVTLRLAQRREWMNPAELRPAHRKHLAGGVQLHRAGAEWNHRSRQ